MHNYDQWRTASPYDDYPDNECCVNCGSRLPRGDDTPWWVTDGYCCEECWKEDNA